MRIVAQLIKNHPAFYRSQIIQCTDLSQLNLLHTFTSSYFIIHFNSIVSSTYPKRFIRLRFFGKVSRELHTPPNSSPLILSYQQYFIKHKNSEDPHHAVFSMGCSCLWITSLTLMAAKQNRMECRKYYLLCNRYDLHKSVCKFSQFWSKFRKQFYLYRLILSNKKWRYVCRLISPSCTVCTSPRANVTAGDEMEMGGQFSTRNVAASASSAVTLGNTTSSGPPVFQYLTPILQNSGLPIILALY